MGSNLTMGVVLCTFNGERYVEAQVQSIRRQTRAPEFILACDDASEDRTFALLEACAAQAGVPMRVSRNRGNLGYLRNFERGILQCQADIIVLSDQDDFWRPDKLATIEEAFLKNPQAGGVFTDAEIVDEQARPMGYGLLEALEVSARDQLQMRCGNLFPVLLRRNVVAGATCAFRASWKDRIIPVPEGAIHDEWIALVLAAHDALRFIPERLIRYRQHAANQIGARRRSVSWIFRSLLRSRRIENQRQLELMQGLAERLVASGAPTDARSAVAQKAEHLKRRVALSNSRLLRAPAVLSEVVNGRYSRYSSGWRTVVRDLVSPM